MRAQVKNVKARDLRQVHKARQVFLPHYNLPAVELTSYRKGGQYVHLLLDIGGQRTELDAMPDYEIMVVL